MKNKSQARIGAERTVLVVLASACASSASLASAQSPFTPQGEYNDTLFVTPNGLPHYAGPMLQKMIGGGDAAQRGGGHYAKVGLSAPLYYAKATEGEDILNDPPNPDLNFRFYVTRGPSGDGLPLPPDITSLNDLPLIVRDGPDLIHGTDDDLACWATTSNCPPLIATLEWARYLDFPVAIQMHTVVSHGGPPDSAGGALSLDRYFEGLGKSRCMWDVADICDPFDDDPTTFEDSGAGFASFSFATPTLLDAEYRSYVMRNLRDGVHQLLQIAADPWYESPIAAMAIDPEISLPAHNNNTWIPQHPLYGGGTVRRPFLEDYNPLTIAAFQAYEQKRYAPDVAPDVDTNNDGITFFGDFDADYRASGWSSTLHPHPAVPSAWNQIDPPRKYPKAKYNPALPDTFRSRYWHEWVNFRIQYVDDFLEDLVATAVDSGWPADRIFTHQTTGDSSYNADRAHSQTNPSSTLYNAEWLDDLSHMEVSRGVVGTSFYGPDGVTSGRFHYEMFKRMDESWGSPEFNPFVPPATVTQSQVETALLGAWDSRAHVLWAHAWGSTNEPLFDCTTHHWVRDMAKFTYQGWTAFDFDPTSIERLKATSTNAYLEATGLTIDAAPGSPTRCTHLAANFYWSETGAIPPAVSQADFKVEFQKGGTWYPVTVTGLLRSDTSATEVFTVDLSRNSNWTGTVTGLRIYPAPILNSTIYVYDILVSKPNFMTTELKELMVAKKDAPRPALVDPYALAMPTNLATAISGLNTSGNLQIYGTDNVGNQFNDFSPTNGSGRVNFDRVALLACGGTTREAILAPAPNLLGMRKTGKFHRVHLPDVADLRLSFLLGLQDGTPATTDGARFRVVLRDAQKELFPLFDREWRKHQWSQRYSIDLSAWRNQDVELAFETHGITDATGDRCAWGEPRIDRGMSFLSAGADDGRVIEKNEGANTGFEAYANDSSGTALRVGDTDGRKQIKSILSFDTSAIPDTATISGASIELVYGGAVGNIAGLGTMRVDVGNPLFNGSATLEIQDFQAAAGATNAATFTMPTMLATGATPTVASLATCTLAPSSLTAINKTGKTQFRVYFSTDDNNNSVMDYVSFFGGEAAGLEPVLRVTYYP